MTTILSRELGVSVVDVTSRTACKEAETSQSSPTTATTNTVSSGLQVGQGCDNGEFTVRDLPGHTL